MKRVCVIAAMAALLAVPTQSWAGTKAAAAVPNVSVQNNKTTVPKGLLQAVYKANSHAQAGIANAIAQRYKSCGS